jgi:hypothetical protein
MNKKILIGFTAMVIAGVLSWNVTLNSQKADLSGISLANVEALATEVGAPFTYFCYPTTGIIFNPFESPSLEMVMACDVCAFTHRDYFFGEGSCTGYYY